MIKEMWMWYFMVEVVLYDRGMDGDAYGYCTDLVQLVLGVANARAQHR